MALKPYPLKLYHLRNMNTLPQLADIPPDDLFAMKVVARVLPFRTNNYVVNELIDWSSVPDDPMFQLNFTQKNMLIPHHFDEMVSALKRRASKREVRAIADRIRRELNPHPAGQCTHNVPRMDDEPVPGIQHKYRETCLVFPASGQTCHAYCTFCFRWPQFVGDQSLRFATDESNRFQEYIRKHSEITDVLFTGGDPLVMSAEKLALYIRPLLSVDFEHVQTIRIGTKAISYWPYRFLSDKDSHLLLSLFEEVVTSGKHLAVMAHFNHHRELATQAAVAAIKAIRGTGAEIRTQSPIVRNINDDARVWLKMWREQVRLGLIPYYMFVERNTGAQRYFAVSLERAFRIFRAAVTRLSGLARAIRGPVMSAHPGKVCVEGIATVKGEQVFVLSFIQGRNPDWCKRPFFAVFDPTARWLDDLEPAFGADAFFFQVPSSKKALHSSKAVASSSISDREM